MQENILYQILMFITHTAVPTASRVFSHILTLKFDKATVVHMQPVG